MYGRYRSRSRDRENYRRSSPRRRDDRGDYQSRKDRSRSPRTIRRGEDMSLRETPYQQAKRQDQNDAADTSIPSGGVSLPGPVRGDRRRENRSSRSPTSSRHSLEHPAGHRHRALDRELENSDLDTGSGSFRENPRRIGAYQERSRRGYSPSGGLAYDDEDWHASLRGPSGARADADTHHGGHGPHHLADPYTQDTLILVGLPTEATEQDIFVGLEIIAENPSFNSDMIRAIRLRNNKRGQRIAFVEFHYPSDAADFIDHHPPVINLPLSHSRGIHAEPVSVSINFGRVREDNDRYESRKEMDGWLCPECDVTNYQHRSFCFRCRGERPGTAGYGSRSGVAAPRGGPILTGETDEDPAHFPSQYLVIRGLEASVTEETLSKGVMKLFLDNLPLPKGDNATPTKLRSTAPVGNTTRLGAKPGSLRRVFLMRDRKTKESWKYGFAEFATLEDAQAAIAKFRAYSKFTIASKPVVVGFIHTGVFVPSRDPHPNGSLYTFSPVYNPDISLQYWDERAYPSILNVNTKPESGPASPEESSSPDKAPGPEKTGSSTMASQDAISKKAKKAKDKAVAMAPQMQMWAKKRAELHGGPKQLDQTEDNVYDALTPAEKPTAGPRAAHWRDTYISYGDWDKVECLLCNKRFDTAQDLRDHEVLATDHASNLDDDSKKENAVAKLAGIDKQPETIIRRKPRDRAEAAPTYTSYADADKLHCLICQRKFKNAATLRLHERESELHKNNMTSEKNVERAIGELAKLSKKPMKMRPVEGDRALTTQYRDRAKERRVAFNQPKKPGMPGKNISRRKEESKLPTETTDTAKKAAPSKGASLLNKMGWTTGQGLGVEGTGRIEAIQTELYMPGVGLGAEGGKIGDAAEEAARQTQGNPYTHFVEKTKDKARERFEKLS